MKTALCSVLFVLRVLSCFSCYQDTGNGIANTVSSVVLYHHWTAKGAGNLRDESFSGFLTTVSINLHSWVLKSPLMLIVAQEIPWGKGNHLWFYLLKEACDHKAKHCASKWQVWIALILTLGWPQPVPTQGTLHVPLPGVGVRRWKTPTWVLGVWDFSRFSNFHFFLTCRTPSLVVLVCGPGKVDWPVLWCPNVGLSFPKILGRFQECKGWCWRLLLRLVFSGDANSMNLTSFWELSCSALGKVWFTAGSPSWGLRGAALPRRGRNRIVRNGEMDLSLPISQETKLGESNQLCGKHQNVIPGWQNLFRPSQLRSRAGELLGGR